MCGGFIGKAISKVTDFVGLTDTKGAEKGYDAEAAEAKAKNEAQQAENQAKAQRSKRKASDVLVSTEDKQKPKTLGG